MLAAMALIAFSSSLYEECSDLQAGEFEGATGEKYEGAVPI